MATYLEAYTDGSYSTKREGVGWGLVLINPDDNSIVEELQGRIMDEDIIQMRNVAGELQAAITAAVIAQTAGITILITYDFEGVEKFVTGAWKIKNAFTMTYREIMLPLYEQGLIKFKYTPAHQGHEWNELADRLAKDAIGL